MDYKKVTVSVVPLDEELVGGRIIEEVPNIMELLSFISHLSLRDQIFMIANILTISGYTQKEISEAMGVTYCAYRDRLREIRKQFKHNISASW